MPKIPVPLIEAPGLEPRFPDLALAPGRRLNGHTLRDLPERLKIHVQAGTRVAFIHPDRPGHAWQGLDERAVMRHKLRQSPGQRLVLAEGGGGLGSDLFE